MLGTTKSFMWLFSIISIFIGAFIVVVEQGELEEITIHNFASQIIYKKHSVILGVAVTTDVIEKEANEQEVNSVEVKEVYSGWQILYSLREWIQTGIKVVIDKHVVSVETVDDFIVAKNLLKLNADYIADLSYTKNMNKIYVKSIKFERK
jgi:GTP:adenosylcobinamide-phosphate guanylyltransferase